MPEDRFSPEGLIFAVGFHRWIAGTQVPGLSPPADVLQDPFANVGEIRFGVNVAAHLELSSQGGCQELVLMAILNRF